MTTSNRGRLTSVNAIRPSGSRIAIRGARPSGRNTGTGDASTDPQPRRNIRAGPFAGRARASPGLRPADLSCSGCTGLGSTGFGSRRTVTAGRHGTAQPDSGSGRTLLRPTRVQHGGHRRRPDPGRPGASDTPRPSRARCRAPSRTTRSPRGPCGPGAGAGPAFASAYSRFPRDGPPAAIRPFATPGERRRHRRTAMVAAFPIHAVRPGATCPHGPVSVRWRRPSEETGHRAGAAERRHPPLRQGASCTAD